MLYVIIGEDHPGTLDQRMAARPSQVERLQAVNATQPAAGAPCEAAPLFFQAGEMARRNLEVDSTTGLCGSVCVHFDADVAAIFRGIDHAFTEGEAQCEGF